MAWFWFYSQSLEMKLTIRSFTSTYLDKRELNSRWPSERDASSPEGWKAFVAAFEMTDARGLFSLLGACGASIVKVICKLQISSARKNQVN